MHKGNKFDRFIMERNSRREEVINNFAIKTPNRNNSLSLSKSNKLKLHIEVQKTYSPKIVGKKKGLNKNVYSALLKNQLFSHVKLRSDIDINAIDKRENKSAFLSKKKKKDNILHLIYNNNTNDKEHPSKRKVNISKHFLNFQMPDDSSDNFLLNTFLTEAKKEKPCQIKVLDAPNLIDDFYLHLLAWSHNDLLSVALYNQIFVLNNKTQNVDLLASFPLHQVCAINFLGEGNMLIIGLKNGEISLFDIPKHQETIRYHSHTERVSVIESIPAKENLFTTGSRDCQINTFDIRQKFRPCMKFYGNKQEICGIKWSPDGKTLASGSNDNRLSLWKFGYNKPLHFIDKAHSSAIRALDWSYLKYNYLATGGGIQDRHIKVWNCNTLMMVHEVDANSQICNLKFSNSSNEMVTTHGFEDNYINIWDLSEDYCKLNLKATLKGHRNRVLYCSDSPNQKAIATGSGDETIRLWNVFNCNKKKLPLSRLSEASVDIR